MGFSDTSLVIASNSSNFDEFGGADKIATELAIFCAGNGWRVHYIFGSRETSHRREHGLEMWRYRRPAQDLNKSAFNLWAHLSAIRLVMRQIEALDSARSYILNGHTALQHLGLILGGPARPKRRQIISVHSPMAEEYVAGRKNQPLSFRERAIARVLHQLESFCYRRADSIQCFSGFTRSLLEKNFGRQIGKRIVVVPGYVDMSVFSPARRLTRQQARMGLSHVAWKTDETLFFCLRRHTERMGLDNLIKAFATLRGKASSGAMNISKCRLIIGGEGHLRLELERLSRSLGLDSCVYFIGRIDDAELAKAYRAADCFVLPSRALECFGLVILEAFAAGTPVIATPIGAIPEMLGPFAAFSMTAGTDPDSIADTMLKFIQKSRHACEEEKLCQYAAGFEKEATLARLQKMITGSGL